MTPREKAQELVNKYITEMPPLINQTGEKIINHAKGCATIAVKELIALSKWTASSNIMNFWEDVENEIYSINNVNDL